MVRTNLNHNNNNSQSNNNNINVTSAIKDNVASINGKSIKPHLSNHGPLAQTKSISSSSSQSKDTVQNNKELTQPKMCSVDQKGHSGVGVTNSMSNVSHGPNCQQYHQTKGPVASTLQRSYSYDSSTSTSIASNHGKYPRDRCGVRHGEGSHQFQNNRTSNMTPRSVNENHIFHCNNNQNGKRSAQMQPQSHYRIYQGPQSLKSSHLPLQSLRHQVVNEHVNCCQNIGDNVVPNSPAASYKHGEESFSGESGSITPTSPPTSSPPLVPKSPTDHQSTRLVHNGINPNLAQTSLPPSHFNHYPPHMHPHPTAAGPQVVPPQPMPQLNLVWQGLPANAQIDPDQMFILSGPFPSKGFPSKEQLLNEKGEVISNSAPVLVAHPIPRGSTVVATPALSPPQWPNGTSLTIHVDSQYELFNRACAAAGIGSADNINKDGNNIQHVSTISFSDSPKFNPEAVPFYPPTSMSSTTSISTDESSSLSSQNSDDNNSGNSDHVKVPKQNGKTVRFQTEAEKTYIHPELNNAHGEGMPTKETNATENKPDNKDNISTRSSTDESSKNDGASETSVETPRKTPGDGMNYRETDNGVINKRQNRLQPMVMVWNTYFPNGKMIPLRQPQPPVYFGPAMTGNSNEQQLSTESVQLQQPQQVMKPSSSNHHHRYHHSQCNHRMNVIPIPETDENSNSEGSPNDVNRVSNNISHSSVSPAVFSTIQQSQQVIGAV